MIKVILFDADGVLINKPKVFSQHFSEEYDIPMEKILPFFENEFLLCIDGRSDLKKELPKYLKAWDWTGSVEDFLAYWHKVEAYSDKELLEDVKRLSQKGILCCVASNQEKFRGEYIMNEMGFKNYFEKFFFSGHLGAFKPSVKFFEELMKSLPGISKDEVLFFDDDILNVESAKKFGIHAEFYSTFSHYKKVLEGYLK